MNNDNLEKIILEMVDLPGLPSIASRALEIIDNEPSVSQVEKFIASDQTLTMRLLKIANSVYYGSFRKVDSIEAAILLIGFNTMKSLIIAASLKDLHRRQDPFEFSLWEHSLAVSAASAILAGESRLANPNESLVAGLIHDVGKNVLNNSIPETYAGILERVNNDGIGFRDAEEDALGFNHAVVGGYVARKWRIPEKLEFVIENHHSKEYALSLDKECEALNKIVILSDELCQNLGLGLGREIEINKMELGNTIFEGESFEELKAKIVKSYNELKNDFI